MTLPEFLNQKPVLYGSTIDKNLKQRIGTYAPRYSKYTNNFAYFLISKNGRKTSHAFTLNRAYNLFSNGKLSTNPEKGKLESYV